MDILEKIFGSAARVKIMRLFMFNPETAFDFKDVSRKTKVSSSITRKEVNNLLKSGLIKKRIFFKEETSKKGSSKKKKTNGFILDSNFPYLRPLENLLYYINPLRHKEIFKKLKNSGNIKLLLITGVFLQEDDSRVDILIVGTKLKRGFIESAVSSIEAEMGKELRYTVFETDDFKYRLAVCDKLVRDIVDYPHEKIVNKLDL